MDLLIHYPEKRSAGQTATNTLSVEAHTLSMNLENHLGNKVKVSFLPNQYYNDKIYTLVDYSVDQSGNSIKISMELKEGSVNINYRIEDVIRIQEQAFFNRIEYKACVDAKEVYNFCLYF